MYNLSKATQAGWDALIAQYPEANFLQSWQWGDAQESMGHTALRFIITHGDKTVGIISAIVKNAKRGRFVEIAGGPLIDWSNRELVDELPRLLFEIGRSSGAVFVRFRPQLPDSEATRTTLKHHGAKLSPMHVTADHTSVIDLTFDNEKLMENMRQQTRYEVRRSGKRNIVVTSDATPALIDELHAIQAETAKRQGFLPPSRTYIASIVEQFGNQAKIYRATKDGVLLNLALFVSFGKEVAYLEAASTIEARREPGAYAIIWQALIDAKQSGYTRLNLWGTAPDSSPNHRYAGVTVFKHGFGGDNVSYLAPHDIVIQPLRYRINYLIETVRKKRRHL